MRFDKVFKRARQIAKSNQTQFAKKLGVTQSMVSKVEAGACPPNAEMLMRLFRLKLETPEQRAQLLHRVTRFVARPR